jgi:hypothetical protein
MSTISPTYPAHFIVPRLKPPAWISLPDASRFPGWKWRMSFRVVVTAALIQARFCSFRGDWRSARKRLRGPFPAKSAARISL